MKKAEGRLSLRAGIAYGLIVGVFALLAYQLYAIQVLGHQKHRKQRDAQSRSKIYQTRARGAIRSSDGVVLALSVPLPSIWADPTKLDSLGVADLSRALEMEPDRIRKRLARRRPDGRRYRFVWLRRRVDPAIGERVKTLLRRSGTEAGAFGLTMEYGRKYPGGSLGAHILGIARWVQGKSAGEGIEGVMNADLNGATRSHEVRLDARRTILQGPGPDSASTIVTLTINAELQLIAEEELKAAMS